MRINQDNNIYNAPDASFLLVQEDSFSGLEDGEIITSVVSKNGFSPMIRFDELDKEIPASGDAYRYSPVGEKHAFRVEKNNGRLSLKDLGVCNDDVRSASQRTSAIIALKASEALFDVFHYHRRRSKRDRRRRLRP